MRWIVGGSVVAVIVGLVATMTIPAQTIIPDQAILKFFPPETQGIAFIDAAALRNAPLVQEFMAEKEFPGSTRLRDFAEATGFTLERDLDRLTIGKLSGRQMLAIAEARYDRFKVEQFLNDKGVHAEAHMGRSIYRNKDNAISFVDNLVIAGQVDAVKKAIEQMSLPGSMPLASNLTDAMRTIEGGNQVWAVGDFPVAELSVQAPGQAQELLKTLQSGTYQMRVDRDVHARATGNFTDADSAETFAGLARGMIGLAKIQVAKEQDLVHVLDGIQIENSGSSVVVNIDESGELLKKLKDFRPSRSFLRRQ